MIHRAPFGSIERFVAILIEHCGGNFPIWLTPNQVSILPISDKFMDYSKEVLNSLKISDIRAEIDERSEKTGRKIRDAEVRKIPFMLIIGERESAQRQISVRRHGGEDLGSMTIQKFKNLVIKEIRENINEFVV